MTLYFRLIFLFLLNVFFPKREKIDISKDLELNLTVLPNDLDVFRHVNNGRYLTLMDLGRFHLLLRSGSMKKIVLEGYRPHILNAFLKYRKELRVFQKFTLKTKLVYWDDKNFYVRHLFLRNDQVCAEALVKGILVKNRKKVPPQEFINNLGFNTDRPEMPKYLEKFIDLSESKIDII